MNSNSKFFTRFKHYFSIWCYRGNHVPTPAWKDLDTGESRLPVVFSVSLMIFYFADNFTVLCTITADISRIPLRHRSKTTGKEKFYRVEFEVVLSFGMTELKAQIAWKEWVSCYHMLFNATDSDYIIILCMGF